MTTIQQVELGVLGPLQVRQFGLPVSIPGAKPRAVLTMLGLNGGSVVAADTLVELLWGDDPPRTAAKALQTHISALRRALGDGFVLTQGTGWTVSAEAIDAGRYRAASALGRDAMASGAVSEAVARFDEALALWRGTPELTDSRRAQSERTRWIEDHAALVEERADAQLATGRAAEIIGELEAAIAEAPLRERRWGQLMLALYRAGRQGEALAAYQRARSLLAEELGVDPGPDLRRLEAAVVAQDVSLELPAAQHHSSVTRAVTFLLTDIEGSTAAWEKDAGAMAISLARHDEIVEQVVTFRGGRLIKTRGEGDATFSVFDRPSAAAAAAIELQEAMHHESWQADPVRIRVALHTGEVEFRGGDYFGRAVNRAARLRSLADGGQILCSGATAELVVDSLADDVVLVDLGTRQLKNLARPERVFELRLSDADETEVHTVDGPIERPVLPAVLAGPGPFVGRGSELVDLAAGWQTTLLAGARAVLIAGEPGVGKTRLAGEWSRRAYADGTVVLYGRCDEDLGAPYQPFTEALRSLVPGMGTDRLRGLRGIEALLPLVPGLADALPELAAPTRADADTERYALFDAVVALLSAASAATPVVLVLDDLHWAAKPTLLLLRHLLRFGDHARVQVIGTYRSTDLDRSHPLAAMLADLHRDGSADRLQLAGLDEDDVTTYVAAAGYEDEDLARALAAVTGGNPFFLIEALRHVDESGGRWDPSTLPQGVREAVTRRLSRLSVETNKALGAAAVVGSRFAVDLVERVVERDLVDEFDEARQAGIVIEEPGGQYRFNHALVRQSLLAELASVRRMRLHQRIAVALEAESSGDEHLAELAYHYFECAWAGNAAKAVDYCKRAADQAMARLAYEGAADLYDKALHALEEVDDDLRERDSLHGELLIARCEASLAAGDVVAARGAVDQLVASAGDSGRLAAWGSCFDGQLAVLVDPERLEEVEAAVGLAAETLALLEDAAGEAKAHTVRATCLGRLGRIGDCEAALDQALTAARRAREHRRVNAVLANAPLAALWGPNPVPRAGGRCLDVVRLLRITTGSPVVEATSTRCQGVLDAFRGRAGAGRQLIESARRSLSELGMRHALLEVEQFAGIIELVADEPAAAEARLRKAYNGFRRMGLDADTAETAALLARACLALGRDPEADELCSESERLAGHALKASISWRTVRAQLLARGGLHAEARTVAEEAVAIASGTDALVDHGDACLALAVVLSVTGDTSGARAAAERAAELYDVKGAAALTEKARRLLDEKSTPPPTVSQSRPVVAENTCAHVVARVDDAWSRDAWDELESLLAPTILVDNHRKIVGLTREEWTSSRWIAEAKQVREIGFVRYRREVLAVRGESLALTRFRTTTDDTSTGAPELGILMVRGIDEHSRLCLHATFDVEDMDAALAELDRRFELQDHPSALENSASRAYLRFNTYYTTGDWDSLSDVMAEDFTVDDRRRLTGIKFPQGRAAALDHARVTADLGVTQFSSSVLATRGDRLVLGRSRFQGQDDRPNAFFVEVLHLVQSDTDHKITNFLAFDLDDFDAAIAELDARYLVGEAAGHAREWTFVTKGFSALNRHEIAAHSENLVTIDHRRGTAFAPGEMQAYITASFEDTPDINVFIAAVHRLTEFAAVIESTTRGTTPDGFEAEWRSIGVVTFEGNAFSRVEMYDESDLDAALRCFDELIRPTMSLVNAATRAGQRLRAAYEAGDWETIEDLFSERASGEDKRPGFGDEREGGRDAEVANLRAVADLGASRMTSRVLAIRGDSLALSRPVVSNSSGDTEVSFLSVIETDDDERITHVVSCDGGDLDAAIAELDARYLAGEGAPHAHTWTVIASGFSAVAQGRIPPTAPGFVDIDHRSGAGVGSGDLKAYLRAGFADLERGRMYLESVHRLTEEGAVVTHVAQGVSVDGLDVEWRITDVVMIDGDRLSRCEMFDEADLDLALARFDELTAPTMQLSNTASRVYERWLSEFMAGDWTAMAETLAENVTNDDRRRVVNGGTQRGRDAVLASMRAIAAIGVTNFESSVIANRGDRLALGRYRVSGGKRPEAFGSYVLIVVEVDADGRFAAGVAFDPGDLDAAFAELDARYLAREGAPHAATWLNVVEVYAAFNRREYNKVGPDMASVDHRRGAAFAPGELTPYVEAAWADSPDTRIHVEAVHRLTDCGAVVTHGAAGTSEEGFNAEWRDVSVLMIDDGLLVRLELFNVEDSEAALARFDELSRPNPVPTNRASQVYQRLWAHICAGDWDAVAEIFTEDVENDDRRRAANAGIERGRLAQMVNLRRLADIGATASASVVATRGQLLALQRIRSSNSDLQFGEFDSESFVVIEIDSTERVSAGVLFDVEDLDAAIAELDHRYCAGEAASHAEAWRTVALVYGELNRGETPAMTSDIASVDHRRGTAFAPGELSAYLQAAWDDSPDSRIHVETVHRLSDRGTVVTQVAEGMSREGFHAEWRDVALAMVRGGELTRVELFDDSDLDTALAKFDELDRSAPELENSALSTAERLRPAFTAGDWDALTQTFSDDFVLDDRRRLVGAGLRDGRDAEIDDLRVFSEIGLANVTFTALATRGQRLLLSRSSIWGGDSRSDGVHSDMLTLGEVDADGRFKVAVLFDRDDVDAAFEELDSRYLAGEAAAHARTWSLVVQTYAAFNRQELSKTTSDWVNVDHRLGVWSEDGDMNAYVSAMWELAPDIRTRIVAVHRLTDLGAVFTHTESGRSQEGFDAEWREIALLTFDGEAINRCELYDETDVAAALSRFDELSTSTPVLENAATRAHGRFQASFLARDWVELAETRAVDHYSDDRRRTVNSGIAQGRGAEIESMRAMAELGATTLTSIVVATRGDRLALCRIRGGLDGPEAFYNEVLRIVEVDAEGELLGRIVFDPEDLDAAYAELDARYAAGEAHRHGDVWSVVAGSYAALNRHQVPPRTADWTDVDHRQLAIIGPDELFANVHAMWDLTPDARLDIQAVHRVADHGAVFTRVTTATAKGGGASEWSAIDLITVRGRLASSCEIFDEADLDAALARFDELSTTPTQLENAASRVGRRFRAAFADRDWDALTELLAEDVHNEDRRRVVNGGARHGRDSMLGDMRAAADFGIPNSSAVEIATRGERLVLIRAESPYGDGPGAFHVDNLAVGEIDAASRICAQVMFDLDDLDGALAELDARYLAGEAARYADTWTAVKHGVDAVHRREIPATTNDFVDIDHRSVAGVDSGDLKRYLVAGYGDLKDSHVYVEAVHRLTDLGAVVISVAKGTTQAGLDVEWRVADVVITRGGVISRSELFDETDVDAALARFDELTSVAPQLENTATRAIGRFVRLLEISDWNALIDTLTVDFTLDDRRRMVGAGIRHGRDAEIEDLRAFTEVGLTKAVFTVLATRGERLVLSRNSIRRADSRPDEAQTDMLAIAEVDADGRMTATVMFDPDDIDAAHAELDARYAAGEAAPHAPTWSLIVDLYAAFNRREVPITTTDWVNVDHRLGVRSASDDIDTYVKEIWSMIPDARTRIEVVHRLADFGAVFTSASSGRSTDGFAAEWKMLHLFAFDRGVFSRCEMFDEADIDAALARFDELNASAPLENAATLARGRVATALNRGDVDSVLAQHIANARFEDRRRGLRDEAERPGFEKIVRALFEVTSGWVLTTEPIAFRGARLTVTRDTYRDPENVVVAEHLTLTEVGDDSLVCYSVLFDPDDIESAVGELDARYLDGEAAPHAHSWSAVLEATAAFNRHEAPRTTPDSVNVDHRHVASFAPGEFFTFANTPDVVPDVLRFIASVHRLTDLGAVVTGVAQGVSHTGFDAEWRAVVLATVDVDSISRYELFDEADLNNALARFGELARDSERGDEKRP